MPNYRRDELEKFLRRKIDGIAEITWGPKRRHLLLTVEMVDGRSVSTQVPNTATDQPRRRENIAAGIRRLLGAA